MNVYIGADHRGFEMKERLKTYLSAKGYEVVDCGNSRFDKDDDYPDFASIVAQKVQQEGSDGRGIVLCGSGIGVSVAANKFAGIRCAIGINREQVFHGRDADDINVLALAPDFFAQEAMQEMTETFLETPFSTAERHKSRLAKIASFEKK